MSFKTEKEMSELLREYLSTTSALKDQAELIEEVRGLFGIPDYLIVERGTQAVEYIIAIELKLTDWRKGLKQAFKYRSFANESFLIVDEASIEPACRNLDEFVHYNIGLASFNPDRKLTVQFYPESSSPFSSHLLKRALGKVSVEKSHLLLLSDEGENSSHHLHSRTMTLRSQFAKCLAIDLSRSQRLSVGHIREEVFV